MYCFSCKHSHFRKKQLFNDNTKWEATEKITSLKRIFFEGSNAARCKIGNANMYIM